MKVIRGLQSLSQPLRATVVTLGNFDGVHRGHQHLLHQVLKHRPPGGVAVAMTFDPHPVEVLHPERSVARLTDLEEMTEQLAMQGLDVLVVQPFTLEFASLPPEEFIENWIFRYLQPRSVVVGYDYAFGKDRQGDFALLKSLCAGHGVTCESVEPFRIEGEIVSSRGLREWVRQGQLLKAQAWLGRFFALRGRVVRGAGRGRGLGFATLNIEPTTSLLPKEGVYATRAEVQGRSYASVTNVGRAPTFSPQGPARVECHVLDADLEAYGEKVKIEFVERLRDEIKFSSVETLKSQIAKDVANARRILGASE